MKIMSTLKVLVPVLLVLAWVAEVRADHHRHDGGGRSCAPVAVVLRPFRAPVVVQPRCAPVYPVPVHYPPPPRPVWRPCVSVGSYYPTYYTPYVPRPRVYIQQPTVVVQPAPVVYATPPVVYQQAPVYVPPPPPPPAIDTMSLAQNEFLRHHPNISGIQLAVLETKFDHVVVRKIKFRATWQEVVSQTTRPDGTVSQELRTVNAEFKLKFDKRGQFEEYDD